jgi:peptide/nickel transport system substrate-binding protein
MPVFRPATRPLQLALAAALAFGVAGAARAETTLRTMIASDLRGLMPGVSPDIPTGTVLQQIYEGLVAWRNDGTVAPMLAEAIDASPDGRSVTFTLREGLRFHNGAPVTAREVAWTWSRYLDPKTNWPCRANFDGTRQIKLLGVEVLDERRVLFRLAEPAPTLLSMMARSDCDSAGIAHPDSVDAEGRWTGAIGPGPFRLEEWRRGQFVQLAAFAGYRSRTDPADGLAGAKRAGLDHIRFTLVPDPSAARVALEAGDIDLLSDIDPTTFKELEGKPGLKRQASPTAALNTIVFRSTDPVLADARVRQGIVAAIDAEGLRSGVYEGLGSPATSLVPATSRAFTAVEREALPYDPARARDLMRAGGYRGGRVTITTNNQFPLMKDTAILVQAMLQAAGMEASVEVLEFGAQLQKYLRGDFQLMVWNITPYLDPVFTFDRFIGAPDGAADKVWRSEAANNLLARLFTASASERQPVIDDLHRLFLRDAPLAVWLNRDTLVATRDTVEGFQPWPGVKPRFWNVTMKGR